MSETEQQSASGMVQRPFRKGTARRTIFGYVTDDHPGLDKVQNAISAVCGVISAASIVGIALLTLWEVLCRSFFGNPQGWVPGIIEQALLVSAAFFGIVTAYRGGAHVAVVSLFNKFPVPVRKALLLFSYIVISICLAFIAISSWRAMYFSYRIGEVMPPGMADLSVPSWIWKVSIPVSCALGLVVVLIDLYREATSSWCITTTDYDPGDATTTPISGRASETALPTAHVLSGGTS
ncbi:TRAP transporter small permease [Rhodococcus sp. IEGM 1366]|uniref:TRAP transporter small permease n=1 Tax=Rhodococcus sp. IEGM 1366 TaxID=3082223 RepID=UPI002955B348|nr:TRAP transporter small permease [Rhodococcus sp. IEGM 1366]MDV8070923.1 TRAP transporter small permease [Rhodococcus sp. IEGM 1366]